MRAIPDPRFYFKMNRDLTLAELYDKERPNRPIVYSKDTKLIEQAAFDCNKAYRLNETHYTP